MSGIAQFRTVVLDCPDTRALAEFYSRLLGWPVIHADDEWAVVSDGGAPKRVGFQRVLDFRPPTWPDTERPQQLHLDVTVVDMDEAEKQVIEIGATKHEHQPSEDDSFRVFLDPAGHPFCLCRE
ncbi:VOC family protein [Nonomuraea jabiensis]|uniref:Catechol 2,3-dioxygenase-like lactoylglutathione lyase family enzyme n=1 Tax=Nonomuraea jabiensis TaxID=882448 RepID=A0A7W9GK12_9ACTN|nr:VOC family protein [Nonomuraea jabiensis]MBB5785190.1 catechol 2,3-dioxygenase-like lactoylglutathione lyase family enzyme [Nonomuraea jabiensis]